MQSKTPSASLNMPQRSEEMAAMERERRVGGARRCRSDHRKKRTAEGGSARRRRSKDSTWVACSAADTGRRPRSGSR